MRIRELEIDIPGKIVRNYDADTKKTTVQLTQEQLQAVREEIAEYDGALSKNKPAVSAGVPAAGA